MNQNRAAILTGIGQITLDERPVPVPAADELLVRVDAVGVCGSDAHYYRHGRIGKYSLDGPLILGHETAGTVLQVGADVVGHKVGDRVAVEPGIPCGLCDLCRLGSYNLCPDVVFHATPPVDGTLQQFITVRSDYAFSLPESVPTEHGALVEPLAVAVWACKKASVAPGSRVVITGAGPVGLLCAQTAAAYGASHIVVTDVDDAKLALALEMGADETRLAGEVNGLEADFDVLIECSGNVRATRDGAAVLAPRGMVVLVGMGGDDDFSIPVSWVQEKELNITGVFRYANCFPLAIELLASGKVRADRLISSRHPLADSETAIDSAGKPGVLKTLILPQT